MVDFPFFDVADISWDKFWKTLVQSLHEAKDFLVDILDPILENTVPTVMTFAVQTLIGVMSSFGRQLGEAIQDYEDQSGQEILDAAAAALEDIFGTDVNLHNVGVRRGPEGRRQTSLALGGAIVDAMFANIGTAGEVTPEKGRDNAEAVIGFAVGTALESWLSSVLTHPILQKFVPNWGDLDDLVGANMGLGRISSRSLRPLYDAAITTPFRWFVNERFSPTIFSAKEAAKLWNMGFLEENKYFETMERLGYTRERAADYKVLAGRFPFKEDIARMIRLGMYDKSQAVTALQQRNFLPDQAVLLAEMYDRLGEDRALQRTKTVAADMFRDLEISEADFRGILAGTGAPQPEIDALVSLGLLERSRPRSIPRSSMERAFKEDIITLEDLRAYYVTEGFATAGATILEQLVILDKDISAEKEAERQEKLKAQEERAAEREAARARAPRATVEQDYIRGLVNESTLRTFYKDLGFDSEAIGLLMKLQKDRRAEREAKAAATKETT